MPKAKVRIIYKDPSKGEYNSGELNIRGNFKDMRHLFDDTRLRIKKDSDYQESVSRIELWKRRGGSGNKYLLKHFTLETGTIFNID